MSNRVLVTGANGLVGRSVCRLLMRREWSVAGAVRSDVAAGGLAPGTRPVKVTDPLDPAEWQPAIDDVEAVVHLIGKTHDDAPRPDESEYRRVNVGITEAVAAALGGGGRKRLIFVSSVKAVGEGGSHPYTEKTPPRPEDAYGRTKLDAERVIDGADLAATILRPPLIYGPGVTANFLRLLKLVDRGVPLPLGRVENRRSILYVENLADAIATALEDGRAVGETYFVADANPISVPGLITEMAFHLGKPARLVPVPMPVLSATARAARRSDELRRVAGSLEVSIEHIRTSLGWAPPYSTTEGVKDTVAWFNS